MELYRVTSSWIYGMLSVALLYAYSTSADQCGSMVISGGRYMRAVCEATQQFPEFCNCNNSHPNIDLREPGTIDRIKQSSLLYYFDNVQEATSSKCYNHHGICLCGQALTGKDIRDCNACVFGDVENMLCLEVDETNRVIVKDGVTGTTCFFLDVCQRECACDTNGSKMPTFGPPIAPNMKTTTKPIVTNNGGTIDESQGMDVVVIVAGIVVFTVILVLFIVLVICCRKHKAVTNKKENPYEAVYSTIGAGGSLPNGNVNLYPNQFYDAQIGRPPVLPPTRQDVPVHYKSMPSLHAMNIVTSDFQDPQYQPYLPHHQPVWKNRPTLHRYPSSDGITPVACGTDEQATIIGTYMKLKQAQLHPPYQTLATTRGAAELRPEDVEHFRAMTSNGRPGYSKQQQPAAEEDEKLITEDYSLLNRDPRSLPTEGTPKEYQNPRQHATYGFERKNNSRTKQFKPIPAKRGQYRSQSEGISKEGDKNKADYSSDSDNEGYQGLGSEGSHYYFKMNTARSDGSAANAPENADCQAMVTENSTTRLEKKKNSRRKPKPRSRRQRRRPTTEVTCEMIENPLASSHDEGDSPSAGEYTDDDIEDGLNRLNEMKDPGVVTQLEEKAEFEDSDYHSPESNST